MAVVPTKIILDDRQRPVAVQVPYADWIRIEDALTRHSERNELELREPADLSQHFGAIALHEDPLDFQERIRAEWE